MSENKKTRGQQDTEQDDVDDDVDDESMPIEERHSWGDNKGKGEEVVYCSLQRSRYL